MAASALAEVAASLLVPQPKESPKSSALANLSPYPDLSMAVHMLEVSLRNATGEKKELLGKWVAALGRMQAEMQALHKMEQLKNRVKISVIKQM